MGQKAKSKTQSIHQWMEGVDKALLENKRKRSTQRRVPSISQTQLPSHSSSPPSQLSFPPQRPKGHLEARKSQKISADRMSSRMTRSKAAKGKYPREGSYSRVKAQQGSSGSTKRKRTEGSEQELSELPRSTQLAGSVVSYSTKASARFQLKQLEFADPPIQSVPYGIRTKPDNIAEVFNYILNSKSYTLPPPMT